MEMTLRSLEGLTHVGLRGGVDMRPTLIRVLTDLYVQKLTHTVEEDRYYTELALRLLDSVDVATRTAVAMRLGQHLAPPRRVIERLAADLPEVRAALLKHAAAAMASGAVEANPKTSTSAGAKPASLPQNVETAPASIGTAIAGELNELFFAANAHERRLILLNLHIVAAPATPVHVARDSAIGRQLEAAALGRKREEFVQVLAHSLRISREQARRVAGDELGEPIVVAAKALAIPRDLLYRILLFVNTAVGHSVERVHALAALYDEMTPQAAHDLVATWQALAVQAGSDDAGPRHQTAADRLGARSTASARRMPAPPLRSVRREAS